MVQDIYLRFRIYTQGSGYKYSWFRIDILRVQGINSGFKIYILRVQDRYTQGSRYILRMYINWPGFIGHDLTQGLGYLHSSDFLEFKIST